MPFKCIESEKLYARDPNLKKEDIQILKEWLKKQPHLPELNESQLIVFLHSCYYRIEPAKVAIDSYFTVRTLCPDLFLALPVDVLKTTMPVTFISVLPKKTPEGYAILFSKLLDLKSDRFNCVNSINLINMVATLYLHENGFDNGAVAIFDMKGFSMGHLTKLNPTIIKQALYHLQEGAPVRIKSIHVINSFPLIDKIMLLVKPFLKDELYKMLQFHSPNSDTLFKTVPKECLQEEYGGQQPSSEVLNEQNMKHMIDNYDFYKWHDNQKVDETKRQGKSKNITDVFGVDGTFKKLEID